MDGLLAPVMILALAGMMMGLALLARRIRRRGMAGRAVAAAMAAFDEGFHSTAWDTFAEARSRDERGQQAPAPGPGHGRRDAGPRTSPGG